MTTVEILYRYSTPPSEAVTVALANTRDVYGIRHIKLDGAACTLLVEYDATRLNAATVTNLMRSTGIEIVEQMPLVAAPQAEPATAAKA
jgi:hypothetical protein